MGRAGSSGRGSRARSSEIKALFDPAGPHESRQDRAPVADGRRDAVPLSAGLSRRCRSRRRSTGRRGTCRTIRSPRRSRRPAPAAILRAASRKAVEMCNNNGHCRKFDAGTMCPSYRVTRDEEHLTRGRANTLRLALSGQLGATDFASPAVREALDLCVCCKGCRRECPTGVDMAKMKIEFAAPVAARRTALAAAGAADRVPAALGAAGRRACRGSPTCATRLPWLRAACRAALGLLGAALAAALARATRSCATRGATTLARADVVLFVDTFTNYFEPENARAALRGAARPPAIASRSRARPTTSRAAAVLRPHLSRRGPGRRGASARRGACSRRSRPYVERGVADRRARAVVPAVAARRVPGAWVSATPRRRSRRARCCSRSSSRASTRRAPEAAARRAAADARAAARPLPPEGVRRVSRRREAVLRARSPGSRSRSSSRAAAAWRAASATRPSTTTSRWRWPSCAAAGGARGRRGHADRRRRHELPPPDRRRHARSGAREAVHVVRVLERALGVAPTE